MKALEHIHRIDTAIETIAEKYTTSIALQIWRDDRYQSLNYQELRQAMRTGAEFLIKKGVQPGDRVILLGETRRLEWAVAFFAIVKAQATAVILDPAATQVDLQNYVTYADARLILTTEDFYELLKNSISLAIFDYEHSFHPFATHHEVSGEYNHSDGNKEIAGILFTSGTTYQPKGVMLTHQNFMHVAMQCIVFAETQPGEQVLGLLPMFHSFGLGAMLMTLFAGGTMTFVNKLQSDSILEAMQKSGTSILPGTPRLLDAFYKNILLAVKSKGSLARVMFKLFCFLSSLGNLFGCNLGKFLFKSVHAKFGGHLRKIISGASPLSAQLTQQLEELGWIVLQGYGLTETGGAISCNQVKRRQAGSVGFVINQSEIKISYPTVTGEGEICFRGPNLMLGYFRDAAATKQLIRDGWLHTGDLGFIDKKGFLKVTGRIKELIVASSGKKIMPDDVEQRYYNIPGIQELAVVAIRLPPQAYDEIHAAIVVDPKFFPEVNDEVEEKIKNSLDQRSRTILAHLRIQQFHIMKELPKTSTFKVRRPVLKKLIEDQLSQGLKEKSNFSNIEPGIGVDEFSQQIIKIITRQSAQFQQREFPIEHYHSLQFDLGIDSLNRIEIAAELNKVFNININESLLFSIDKVGDVVQLVKTSLGQMCTTSNISEKIPQASIIDRIPKKSFLANKLFFGLFYYASRVAWKFEVEGLENLSDTMPFILCPNHVTNLDLLFVASCLKTKTRIDLCCFAKEEIFENYFFKHIARICHSIPVDRDGDISTALQVGQAALKSGRNLLINPEGTRSIDGILGPFRKGAAYLSLQTGYPLIPVKIMGGEIIFPPHLKWPRFINWRLLRRYRIKIVFGQPLSQNFSDEELLTLQLRREVEALG